MDTVETRDGARRVATGWSSAASSMACGGWATTPTPRPATCRAKIEACLEQGITTIDQADIYGGYKAEEILGAALKGSDLSDRIEIVTKCGIVMPAGRHSHTRLKHYDTGRAHIEQSVDHSLRLMGVDKIDLLLVHRPDPLMDHHETGARARRRGRQRQGARGGRVELPAVGLHAAAIGDGDAARHQPDRAEPAHAPSRS